MDVSITGNDSQLSPSTASLLRRMLCPMTGLSQSIGFVARGALEPRIAIAGGEMTGVHVIRGMPAPRDGAYHIGGSGTTYEEAVISTLGETVERYAHYAFLVQGHDRIVRTSLQEMREAGLPYAISHELRFFSEEQYARPGFPFVAFDPASPIGWIAARSLIDGAPCWIPAQEALVGYGRPANEPPYMIGVTTGTASHTVFDRALKNALLELVQIDSAMGHWYGRQAPILLGRDTRTRVVDRLIERRLHRLGEVPRFFWLPNADLPGFAIACVIQSEEVPRAAVGLGCDLTLERAMYRSFLEGVAVAQLAKVILYRQSVGEFPSSTADAGPPEIYDLDTNVAYYAREASPRLQEKFPGGPGVPSTELPPDEDVEPAAANRRLIDAFADTGKALYFLDLTTCDVEDLGFRVARAWSPDTLSLPLPSAPPVAHERFQAYGGIAHDDPHPYP